MELKEGKLVISEKELRELILEKIKCEPYPSSNRCLYYGAKKKPDSNFENCIFYQLASLYNPEIKTEAEDQKKILKKHKKKYPLDKDVYAYCPICRAKCFIGNDILKDYNVEKHLSNLEIEITKD